VAVQYAFTRLLADAAPAHQAIPTRSLLDMLVAGGPLMIPLGLASFLLLLITFERMISLRRRKVVPRLFVQRFLLQLREAALDRSDALER
jgi:biopolymer transport protein ExbB